MWNANQILQHNGFNAQAMKPAEVNDVLQALLQDNRAEFGHEYVEEPSASGNALLTKYYYVVFDGIGHVSGSTEQRTITSQLELQEDRYQKSVASSSGNSADVTSVKEENPRLNEFKEKLATLASGKKAMEGTVSGANDLWHLLKQSRDESVAAKATNVKSSLEQMTAHLDSLREFLAAGRQLDASAPDLAAKIAKANKLSEVAMAHVDGFKFMKKRYMVLAQP